ncbi:hypothetical protein WJX73_007635 [Symbiochloris irregularis]|uniref:Phosphodiesterase n=1 Tax=Symbiochloris irregularis TaxID=706552 RepID=A0AAW1PWK4_9CHLO
MKATGLNTQSQAAGDVRFELLQEVLRAIEASVKSRSLDSALQALPSLLSCEVVVLHFIEESLRRAWQQESTLQTGLPLSKGIVGFVALTGQVRNIADVTRCRYFDVGTDGSGTHTTLCCPVCDVHGKRLAVLQAINKAGDCFTDLDQQMLLRCCSHIGNVLSLSELHNHTMADHQRMTALCKALQRLQCSSTLDAVCTNILRAANELLHAQPVLLLLVDQANDRLWTRWYSRTALTSQSKSTHALLPRDSASSASHWAVLDLLVIEAGFLLSCRRDEICVAAALAACTVMQASDNHTDSVLQAQMQALVQPPPQPQTHPGLSKRPSADGRRVSFEGHRSSADSRRSVDSQGSGRLPLEQLDSWSLEPDKGPGLLDSLASTPSTPSIPPSVKEPPPELVDGIKQHKTALSAWYSRELCEAQECTKRVAQPPRNVHSLPPTPAQLNPGVAKGLSNAVSRVRDRRAMLLDGIGPLKSGPAVIDSSLDANGSCEDAPTAVHELLQWDVDFLALSGDEMVDFIFKCFVSSGVIDHFALKEDQLWAFIREVRAHHRDNPYHNLSHTSSVLQAAYLIMRAIEAVDILPKPAILAVLIAALCHDLDHDGHTNSFHVAAGTEWARQYNDICVMEMHHCTMGFALLHKSQLLQHLDTSVQKDIRRMVIAAVMASDIGQHFSVTSEFCMHGPSWGAASPQDLVLLCKAIVHAADISNPARPFPIHAAMAQRLHQELQAQAAEEQALGLSTAPHREARSQLVQCQAEACFIQAIALPLWRQLAASFPALLGAVSRMETNLRLRGALSRLTEDEILQVHNAAEQARASGRLAGARWKQGEGKWAVQANVCAGLLISSPKGLSVIDEGEASLNASLNASLSDCAFPDQSDGRRK